MPIKPIVLQRRHAELGRIRLGHKAATSNGGSRPAKLAMFRFTSPSERYVTDLATLYGGTPRPWDNNGVAEFEVFTEAKTMPVIAVKGGLSQWMETWSGGGCIHRCDGETNQLTNQLCDPTDRAHVDAKPTTRLSVMLPELDAIGVWRLESHGWNAAAEIPAVAELAQYVGDLVPAHLNLVERRAVKDGKTSRFVVPVLDLQIGTQRLRELVAEKSGTAAPELSTPDSAPARPALAAARPDYRALADAAPDFDTVRALWTEATEAGHLDGDTELQAYLTDRGNVLRAAAAAPANQPTPAAAPAEPQPNPDGTYDAETVEDPPAPAGEQVAAPPGGEPDPDYEWQKVLRAAGERGWGLTEVTSDFKDVMGLIPDEASGSEIASYLHTLLTGEQVGAA